MNMEKTLNTYLTVTVCISRISGYRFGHIYTSNEIAKLDLHLDVSYEQAKRELARLMLRTGKMPQVYQGSTSVTYSLAAFLD